MSQYARAMPIKTSGTGRYPEGSEQDKAHKMLQFHRVEVDHVYGIDEQEFGMAQITFTGNGRAQTAFVEHDKIVHVMDGWDVLPPKADAKRWRGGY